MKVCGKDIHVEGRLVRIGRLEGDGYEFIEDPEAMLDGLRKCGSRIDIFTFMQRVTDTKPKYHYAMEWDNFAALAISTFDYWWTEQIGFKARNKAKQAEKKGVTIREVAFDNTLVHGIWEVYNECPIRQGRRFRHFGKDLETVRGEEATFLERSVFIGAFLAERLIGFVKLVADETGTQAGLMNIVSMIEQRDKAPTNALIAHAVRSCAERGIRFLVYSQFSYGRKQQDGIGDFKERNGFQKIDVPRFYIPLNAIGWTAYRLGLHKPTVDRVPTAVVARLRELRNAWYNRKFQQVAGG
jgi:hypothetical protein